MRVLIIGAGLAGPCLAHGLRANGHEVRLFERDAALDARAQGYRIHINGDGDAALRRWLPADAYAQATATACEVKGGVTMVGPDLKNYTEIPIPPEAAGITVDRLTLRAIMLRELVDVTRFGAAFSRYELLEDGRVRVHFTDGSSDEGDVLVATDGANSLARRQLLPDMPVTALDRHLIYGRTPLSEATRELTPPPALGGFLGVVGADGRQLAVAAQLFRRDPAEFGLPAGHDYVMWGLTIPAAGDDLHDLGARELLEVATGSVSDWHPSLGELLRHADPDYLVPAAIHTSRRPASWPPVPVTLVGDAAHPMPPAGISAGVAIHDAGLLASHLISASQLLDALRGYEVEMLDYGFAAVATSLRNHQGQY
ncbi:FAD-dependent oxidoreductase [Nocardia sp. NPDC004722]